MLFLIHALIGGVIGASTHSFILAVLAAIVSHFILDAIPHWDGDFNMEEFKKTGKAKISRFTFATRAFDLILAIALITYFYHSTHQEIILTAAIAALLPDIVKIGYYTPLKNQQFFKNYLKFHASIQKEASWKIGLLIQFCVLVLGIFVYSAIISPNP